MTSAKKRTALVTGANRGIGLSIARQLAQRGIKVLIGARDQDKGIAACKQLQSEGLEAYFILLDVTRAISIEAAIGKIKDDFRGLDILVNNAGIMIDTQSGILELDPAVFHHTLTTNVFGPLLLAQACIPLMKANGYGRIVNMASTLGSLKDISNPDSLYGTVLSPAYRLSKTLLNGITVLLANALRGTNILVNSACPGWVRTDMGGSQAPLTSEQGADTPVWLATLPDGGPHGGFFRERQPIPW
ncbi:MAG: SDR family oxidoreductase [Desulfobacterales bacterium]|jgi:NAD(P)-dependent dehydrogenase (short-subunit alcohol dehydrogenase family)